MLRGSRLAVGLLALALLLGGCGGAQGVQDTKDQAALRRLFGLPRRAEVVSYSGHLAMVGVGQREGLGLRARFQLEPEQAMAFLETAAEAGWEPLPIEAGLVERIPFRELDVPLHLSQGMYSCQTTGNEVLHAETTCSCALCHSAEFTLERLVAHDAEFAARRPGTGRQGTA